ncbi:MAG: hypothetical protein ACYTHK_04040 [Planctomycetota bacterium]
MIINEHCPHCGESCVSNLRKLVLLPGATTPCRSCGQPVSVPFFAVVSIFPLLMAYLLIFMVPEGALAMRLGISAVLVGMAAYYQVFLLPLVAR